MAAIPGSTGPVPHPGSSLDTSHRERVYGMKSPATFLCAVVSAVVLTVFSPDAVSDGFPRGEVKINGDGIAGPYQLPVRFIGGTVRADSLFSDGARVTAAGVTVIADDPVLRTVTFGRSIEPNDIVYLSYAKLPGWLPEGFDRDVLPDSTAVTVASYEPPWSRTAPNPFPGLTFGGSKTFEVSAGGNRDIALNQTLRLNITGNLTDDVTLNAVVSDQNVPITPEGDTRELSELDRVLIEVRGPRFSVDMGDTDLSRDDGRWMRYSRRLSGASGTVRLGGFGVHGAGAVSDGTFMSTTITPVEGNQGPYRLIDSDGKGDVSIVPGTERLWINGVELTRGLTGDYIIDYDTGEVVFTERRIIGSDMRIVADYEYTSERFRKTFYSGGADGSLWGGKVKVTTLAAREADDASRPVLGTLDDATKRLLAGAGDTPLTGEGIRPALIDTTGTYDSVGDHLVYNPARNGAFNVTFSWVGANEGSYRYVGGGVYEWVAPDMCGPGSGASYKPGNIIHAPQSHTFAGARVTVTPHEAVRFEGEAAGSSLDRNSLSSRDDSDNDGGAFRGEVSLEPTVDAGVPVKLSLRGSIREQGATFRALDRDRTPEENRRWGLPLTAGADKESAAEYRAGIAVAEGTFTGSGIEAGGGQLAYADTVTAGRVHVGGTFMADDRMSGRVIAERIDREGLPSIPDETIDRITGDARFTSPWLTPSLRWEGERAVGTGELSHGASYGELEAGIVTAEQHGITAEAGWLYRVERAKTSAWRDSSIVRGGSLGVTAGFGDGGGLSVRYARRDRTGGDRRTTSDQAAIETYYRPAGGLVRFDMAYRAGRERDAGKSRNYIYAGSGYGSYRWEDNDDDGVRGVDEFIPDEYGDYYLYEETLDEYRPVNAVSVIGMIGLTVPGTVTRRLVGSAIPVETETSFEINEKSSAPARDVFLLDLSRFRKAGMTTTGDMRFQEDVTVPVGEGGQARARILRSARYDAAYVSGAERRTNGEESLRFRLPVSSGWDTEATLARTRFSRFYDAGRFGSFEVRSYTGTAVLSHHLRSDLTVRFGAGGGTDDDGVSGMSARYYHLEPGAIFQFGGKGRLEASYTRTSVVISGADRGEVIPYTMAGGRKEGVNHDVTVSCDYRVSHRMSLVATYTGRKFADRDFEHFARTQLRAMF